MGTYSAAVLADSPTYYWRLNTMGGAYPAGNGNAVGWWGPTTGVHETREGWTGVDSDGRSVLVNGGGLQATDSTYTFTLPFSVEWWFFAFNAGNLTPNPTVALIGNNASVAPAYWNWQASSRTLTMGDRTGFGHHIDNVALHAWHHMGFAIDTGGLTYWYLDGVSIGGGSPGATLSFLQINWQSPQAGSPWLYTELAMYGHLLGPEFATHYAAGSLAYPTFSQNLASCG